MRVFSWLLGVLCAAFLCVAPQTIDAQSDLIPKEVQALFTDIADIDKMRVLNPLKLKTDQLDRIIATVKKHETDYNKSLTDAAAPPIRNIAQEIKETRSKMLSGAPIPKDFDEKVKKLQGDFVKRRNKQEFDTLKSLSDSVRAILTEEQLTKAISLTRKLTAVDGKERPGNEAQFFHLFVKGVFIDYPGIVPLLEDMKKAGGSARAGGVQREVRR